MEPPKTPRPHQIEAIEKTLAHFKENDRGQLIMACGTGKTLTSLRIAEAICAQPGSTKLVLYLVPSIALLGQAYNAWAADTADHAPLYAIGVCSDPHATEKRRKSTKDNLFDQTFDNLCDVPLSASTNPERVAQQLMAYYQAPHDFKEDRMCVVFSTYQSIEVVEEAQKRVLEQTQNRFGNFEICFCDEAHRTTQACAKAESTPSFVHVHDENKIHIKKRLYMTATPRIYSESAKSNAKAKNSDVLIASMDDESVFGPEIHRISFNDAVQKGLLTDYKVIVLTACPKDLPESIHDRIDDPNATEIDTDIATKLYGTTLALSKQITGDEGKTWQDDPQTCRRALLFANVIGDEELTGSSKNVAHIFESISDAVVAAHPGDHIVHVECEHVDGSMGANERYRLLEWLDQDAAVETCGPHVSTCRILTNVRCLSEGVDVPALDAVVFLAPRKSQIDVVQSVGRVMRNFRRGEEGGKKYGYIIIPVVIPNDMPVEKALEDNERFKNVWQVLNALRSHDDHFNAIVNQISLNDTPPRKIVVGGGYIPDDGIDAEAAYKVPKNKVSQNQKYEILQKQLELFKPIQDKIYAKLVEKCGDRQYWQNWVKDIAQVALNIKQHIELLLDRNDDARAQFERFMSGLHANINDSLNRDDGIEFLAQHIVSGPIFDALFEDYHFSENNAVSRTMQSMVDFLNAHGLQKDIDTRTLQRFYTSVRNNVTNITTLRGKQQIIKDLYGEFFRAVFPRTVEKLGIVYTPVECVDFIINSVEALMHRHFDGASLSDSNVHILDPFVGTGTFITRLLQSGVIRERDLLRKYRHEIHCNEIVPLAYYIADVNIENTFHALTRSREYIPYDGIVLTDTFQLAEGTQRTIPGFFDENRAEIENQRKAPIRVIICNPPYSAKQTSANDNAQNKRYPILESHISQNYLPNNVNNINQLFDSYIKAIRWATDRISSEGGIIGMITNSGWLEKMIFSGVRQSLLKEFDDIYIYNLRGGINGKNGDLAKKEGGNVFNIRVGNTIFFLVKKSHSMDCMVGEVSPYASISAVPQYAATPSGPTPNPSPHGRGLQVPRPNGEGDLGGGAKANIHYYAVADYLSREEKLAQIVDFKEITNDNYTLQTLEPDEHHDWLNKRSNNFQLLIPIESETKFSQQSKNCIFDGYSLGVNTNRDSWVFNSSKSNLSINIMNHINFYNSQVDMLKNLRMINPNASPDAIKVNDSRKIKWSSSLESYLNRMDYIVYQPNKIVTSLYRPYFKQYLYFGEKMIHRPGQNSRLFPSSNINNYVIVVKGIGGSANFGCIMSNVINTLWPDGGAQCFPLYYYDTAEDAPKKARGLFDGPKDSTNSASNAPLRHDGITDWILEKARNQYTCSPRDVSRNVSTARQITKEDIFYYVYGILHSPKYRETFANDLKKSLPRIPLVEKAPDFWAFSRAGRELGALHVNYETGKMSDDVTMIGAESGNYIVKKMKFDKDKRILYYNSDIRIENIPLEVDEYIVNGRSALGWLVDQYQVSTDKASGIVNDPNDWAREHDYPRYILDLVLRIIELSVRTVEIVRGLPELAI